MLNDFTWNMNGYISKYPVNPSDDGIPPYVAERIFQLEPEPPAVDSLNEYIPVSYTHLAGALQHKPAEGQERQQCCVVGQQHGAHQRDTYQDRKSVV